MVASHGVEIILKEQDFGLCAQSLKEYRGRAGQAGIPKELQPSRELTWKGLWGRAWNLLPRSYSREMGPQGVGGQF